MARIRIFTEKQPLRIEKDGVTLWICQCGLTKNYPYCDGSHKQTEGEDDCLYCYSEDGTRSEITLLTPSGEKHSCCGGSCGCGHH